MFGIKTTVKSNVYSHRNHHIQNSVLDANASTQTTIDNRLFSIDNPDHNQLIPSNRAENVNKEETEAKDASPLCAYQVAITIKESEKDDLPTYEEAANLV